MYGLYRQCTSFLGASSRSCGSLKACFYLWKNACLPRLPPPRRRRRRSSVRFTRLRRRRYDKSRLLSLSPFPGFKTLSGKSNAFHEKPAVLAKVPAKSWLSAMQGCIRLVQLNTQLCDTFCTVVIMFVWLSSSHTFLLTGPPHSHFLFLTQDRAFPALPRVSPPSSSLQLAKNGPF